MSLSSRDQMAFPLRPFWDGAAYLLDLWQRNLLFADVLRQRGNTFLSRQETPKEGVLSFQTEIICDGRLFTPAANYLLLQILPEEGKSDFKKRPYLVVDPRAGQAPGISGLKKDSEVGLALAQGHPVYFASFLEKPVAGQDFLDISFVLAQFVHEIQKRHPEARPPCLIGNCQAGWQIALMACLEDVLTGPILLAGAPLSYWAGRRGESPVRTAAGMMGGSWVTAFLGDIGSGLFDGAWLVSAFEARDPVQAFWRKWSHLFEHIDTEASRFLAFEKWWGSPVFFDAQEMQFVTDELFIGNHLVQGKIYTKDGRRADLRTITAPLLIFCSKGDDITPPAQALSWLLDVYHQDDEILANEQTIIYSLHEKVGHLGLFVAGSIVGRQYLKFFSDIDMMESLPPGLYEACFLPKDENTRHGDLVVGNDVLRFEKRSLDDIRALGCNTPEEDACFEAVRRASENIQGLYQTFFSPFIRFVITEEKAEILRHMHPLRLSFSFFSDQNPFCQALAPWAAWAKGTRKKVSEENIFRHQEKFVFENILNSFAQRQSLSAHMAELLFFSVYGAPLVQASLGLKTNRPYRKPPPARDKKARLYHQAKMEELAGRYNKGGYEAGLVRGLLYVSLSEKIIDERAFRFLQKLDKETGILAQIGPESVREQYFLLMLNEEKALETLPLLIGREKGKAQEALTIIRNVLTSSGRLSQSEEKCMEKLVKSLL